MVMGVFMPFITGFAIAYLLNSPMCFYERNLYRDLRYRRGLSIVTVYLLVVAILSILLNLIIPRSCRASQT
jgi:predicted PurR-regulated permease PerM